MAMKLVSVFFPSALLLAGCANFDTPPETLLSVSKQGEGRIVSVPAGIDCGQDACAARYETESQVTLTAQPLDGSTAFSHWEVRPPLPADTCGTDPSCKIELDHSAFVVAHFKSIQAVAGDQKLLTLSAGPLVGCRQAASGRITSEPPGLACMMTVSASLECRGTFPTGTKVRIEADGIGNSKLSAFSGDCVSTNSNCTVAMTEAKHVNVAFCGGHP